MSGDAFLTAEDVPTLHKLETVATNIARDESDAMKRSMFGFVADLCAAYVREIERSRP